MGIHKHPILIARTVSGDWIQRGHWLVCKGEAFDRLIWFREPTESLRRAVLPSLCPVTGEEFIISEDGLALIPGFRRDDERALRAGVATPPPSSPPLPGPEGTPHG